VPVIPDFIANGGGVIAGSVELRRSTIGESFETIMKQIRYNVSEILALSKAEGLYPGMQPSRSQGGGSSLR